MPETCRDIYDNKSQLLHQVGTCLYLHFFLEKNIIKLHTIYPPSVLCNRLLLFSQK